MNEPFLIDGVEYVVESGMDLGDDLSKNSNLDGFAVGQSNGGNFILVTFSANKTGTVAKSLNGVAVFLIDSLRRQYYPVGLSDHVTLHVTVYKEFSNSDLARPSSNVALLQHCS